MSLALHKEGWVWLRSTETQCTYDGRGGRRRLMMTTRPAGVVFNRQSYLRAAGQKPYQDQELMTLSLHLPYLSLEILLSQTVCIQFKTDFQLGLCLRQYIYKLFIFGYTLRAKQTNYRTVNFNLSEEAMSRVTDFLGNRYSKNRLMHL